MDCHTAGMNNTAKTNKKLTKVEKNVLGILGLGSTSVSGLVANTGHSRGGITAALRRLEGKGLVDWSYQYDLRTKIWGSL